jgi:hypothetical protein
MCTAYKKNPSNNNNDSKGTHAGAQQKDKRGRHGDYLATPLHTNNKHTLAKILANHPNPTLGDARTTTVH